MELPNIGRHCCVPNCNQLDFLPLECECKLIFCRKHFLEHATNCDAHYEQEVNIAWGKQEQYYECSETGCTERSIVPLFCEKCKNHCCIKHRHVVGCTKVNQKTLLDAIERCNAPKLQYQEAKTAADKEIEAGIQNARKKGKNDTANQVQLMRLKAKATGLKNIPTTDRIYFLIFNFKYWPDGRPVFISKDWTIGRAIDAIAEECRIPNNNNKPLAPKLRLFKKDNKEIVSYIMSDKITTLISNSTLINGESLIIDYMDK